MWLWLVSALANFWELLKSNRLCLQVPINSRNAILFCADKCDCPASKAMENAVKRIQYDVYVKRQKKNETIHRVSTALNIDDHTGARECFSRTDWQVKWDLHLFTLFDVEFFHAYLTRRSLIGRATTKEWNTSLQMFPWNCESVLV